MTHDTTPAEDRELHGLLEMDATDFGALYAEELAGLEAARKDADVRMGAYLDDMKAVLRMEGGAGMRVLRRLLDGACENQIISRTNSTIYAAAALHDYAREVMRDIALADPQSYIQLLLQGARARVAQEHKERNG